VAHDLSALSYSGHNRKENLIPIGEDLIPIGKDRTWGYELFQSLVIKAGIPVGVAVTELRNNHGILSWKIERLFYFENVGFRLACWHQENAELIARRLLLVQMAAPAVYRLSQSTDEKSIQVMEALAKLGGWCVRKQTPIDPTMLMRGSLLFLGTMQFIQIHTPKELFAMTQTLEPYLGQILRR
jgi:hypothetical protein